MPRVTYVKAAQQRYKTVPVLDEQGNPTYRERVLKRPTKRGVTVTRQRVTVADKNQPLAPLTCDYCRQPIEVGQAYKWIKPKSGPYGGRQRSRHAHHPNWHPWEYSQSLSARIQEIQHNAQEAINAGFETQDDVTSILSDVADAVRDLAEEKREGASNIEDGFGHPTSQSEELEQIADDLDSWADDIEGADIPEDPDPEDAEPEQCSECEGEGTVSEGCADCTGSGVIEDIEGNISGDCTTCGGEGILEVKCETCDGTGEVEATEVSEAQMDEWRDQVEQALSIVDESPV